MTKHILSLVLFTGLVLPFLAGNSYAMSAAPAVAHIAQTKALQHGNNYRAASYRRRSRGTSKTRTALRIAAPAAVGAGIGALAGGKKGAAVGALLGGGGGAVYHLYKSRRR